MVANILILLCIAIVVFSIWEGIKINTRKYMQHLYEKTYRDARELAITNHEIYLIRNQINREYKVSSSFESGMFIREHRLYPRLLMLEFKEHLHFEG